MRTRRLKVYHWQGFRPGAGALIGRSWQYQTREIVAAHSMAEVARIAGVDSPRQLFNLGETGNRADITQALTEPGTHFWRPLDARGDFPWRRALDKEEQKK